MRPAPSTAGFILGPAFGRTRGPSPSPMLRTGEETRNHSMNKLSGEALAGIAALGIAAALLDDAALIDRIAKHCE